MDKKSVTRERQPHLIIPSKQRKKQNGSGNVPKRRRSAPPVSLPDGEAVSVSDPNDVVSASEETTGLDGRRSEGQKGNAGTAVQADPTASPQNRRRRNTQIRHLHPNRRCESIDSN